MESSLTYLQKTTGVEVYRTQVNNHLDIVVMKNPGIDQPYYQITFSTDKGGDVVATQYSSSNQAIEKAHNLAELIRTTL